MYKPFVFIFIIYIRVFAIKELKNITEEIKKKVKRRVKTLYI
jgi:glutamine synthetase adenylyltransferase